MRSNKIISIFGRKGTGKSVLVKAVTKDCRRLLLIDPMSEYETGKVTYDYDEVLTEILKPEFRIVYRPLDNEQLDGCLYGCLIAQNMTLAVDEVDNYTNSYYLSEPLRQIIHYGRHYNISSILASRQPNRIRNDITSQSDHILCFQAQGHHTVAYLNNFADCDFKDDLLSLDNHAYINVVGEFSLEENSELP